MNFWLEYKDLRQLFSKGTKVIYRIPNSGNVGDKGEVVRIQLTKEQNKIVPWIAVIFEDSPILECYCNQKEYKTCIQTN